MKKTFITILIGALLAAFSTLAQISTIADGESMSSVRTKINQTILQTNTNTTDAAVEIVANSTTNAASGGTIDISSSFGSAAWASTNDFAGVITNEYTVDTPYGGETRTLPAFNDVTSTPTCVFNGYSNVDWPRAPGASGNAYPYVPRLLATGSYQCYDNVPPTTETILISMSFDTTVTASSTTNGIKLYFSIFSREPGTATWDTTLSNWGENYNATNENIEIVADVSAMENDNVDYMFRVAAFTPDGDGANTFQPVFITGTRAISPPESTLADFVATWAIDSGATEQ